MRPCLGDKSVAHPFGHGHESQDHFSIDDLRDYLFPAVAGSLCPSPSSALLKDDGVVGGWVAAVSVVA